jgi:hypothetical protein
MNMNKAVDAARNNTRTWGELVELLDSSDKSGMCRWNRHLTKRRAADIAVAQMLTESQSEVPSGTRWSEELGKTIISAEGMLIMNILKEFR